MSRQFVRQVFVSHAGLSDVPPATPPPSLPCTLGTLPTPDVSPGRRVPPPSSAACKPPPSVHPTFDRADRLSPPYC